MLQQILQELTAIPKKVNVAVNSEIRDISFEMKILVEEISLGDVTKSSKLIGFGVLNQTTRKYAGILIIF